MGHSQYHVGFMNGFDKAKKEEEGRVKKLKEFLCDCTYDIENQEEPEMEELIELVDMVYGKINEIWKEGE